MEKIDVQSKPHLDLSVVDERDHGILQELKNTALDDKLAQPPSGRAIQTSAVESSFNMRQRDESLISNVPTLAEQQEDPTVIQWKIVDALIEQGQIDYAKKIIDMLTM